MAANNLANRVQSVFTRINAQEFGKRFFGRANRNPQQIPQNTGEDYETFCSSVDSSANKVSGFSNDPESLKTLAEVDIKNTLLKNVYHLVLVFYVCHSCDTEVALKFLSEAKFAAKCEIGSYEINRQIHSVTWGDLQSIAKLCVKVKEALDKNEEYVRDDIPKSYGMFFKIIYPFFARHAETYLFRVVDKEFDDTYKKYISIYGKYFKTVDPFEAKFIFNGTRRKLETSLNEDIEECAKETEPVFKLLMEKLQLCLTYVRSPTTTPAEASPLQLSITQLG